MKASFTVGILGILLTFSVGLAAGQTVTVTMIEEKLQNYALWQNAVADEYMARNPGVKIDLVAKGGDPKEKMLTMVLAGLPLDIGWYDPFLIPEWARDGLLADLTPLVERDASHFAGWFPQSLEIYQYKGRQYGLPRDLQLPVTYYNKTRYGEVGLATPSDDWTMGDLLQHAVRLRKETGDGDVTMWGFNPPSWRNWVPMVWNLGGDFFDNWTVPTRFIGDNDGVRAALEYFIRLREAGAIPPDPATNHPIRWMQTAFTTKRIAIGMGTSFHLNDMKRITDFEYDVTAIPHGPGDYTTSLNAVGWFVFQTSADLEAAWDVLKFFTGEWALRKMVDMVGAVPPQRDAVVNHWLPTLEVPANKNVYIEYVALAKPLGTVPESIFGPVDDHFTDALWGEEPIPAALENMKRQATAAIEQFWELDE